MKERVGRTTDLDSGLIFPSTKKHFKAHFYKFKRKYLQLSTTTQTRNS